ncbi:MAG: hypothetical protein AAF614_34615 [Chloroflexota bacterium]
MSTSTLTVVAGNAAIVLNDKAQKMSGTSAGYWMMGFSDHDLSVIANEKTDDATSVPAAINDLPEGAIFVITGYGNYYGNYPQGDLINFLNENGAGVGLSVAEQIAGDAGSAAGGAFNYYLVGQIGGSGYEGYSFYESVAGAFELHSTQRMVDGKEVTFYFIEKLDPH